MWCVCVFQGAVPVQRVRGDRVHPGDEAPAHREPGQGRGASHAARRVPGLARQRQHRQDGLGHLQAARHGPAPVPSRSLGPGGRRGRQRGWRGRERGAAAAAAAAAAGDIDNRLVSLDQKVSDIGSKLSNLKNQLDTNFLPADDINAEASEKKPVSMNVVDIGKVLSAEVTRELQALRTATASVDRLDRKLTFHMNVVSENLGKVLSMVADVHDAVVEHVEVPASSPASPVYRNRTATTTTTTTTTEAPTAQQPLKRSKLDRLVKQMHPILSVSEKMDEVWDVVVGTKTSVDDLVPSRTSCSPRCVFGWSRG